MFKNLRRNKNNGFSLVELIVVIAVMAVLLAVLSPSLLQYVERSRAQKDDSAMSEVTNAIKLAMADQDVYDEMLQYNEGVNAAGYTDRVSDETQWGTEGEMRGVTITFTPKDKVITLNEGSINTLKEGLANIGTMNGILYNKIRVAVGDTIDLSSQTYRNSPYTVFIEMGTLGGNDPSKMNAINVYGQWGGTNLIGDETSGGESGGDTADCTETSGCGAANHKLTCPEHPKYSVGNQIEVDATFGNNDIADVIAVCQAAAAGNADAIAAIANWNVGDSMPMAIDGTEYHIQIVGKGQDTYTSGGTAPLTFQLVECYGTEHKMNITNTNTTGWSGSAMRTAHLAEILAAMPADVQDAIQFVDKKTLKGDKSGLETTSDQLFLLSEFEVFGTTRYSNGFKEGSAQYDYYAAGNSKSKYYNRSALNWWLRTPYYSMSYYFSSVNLIGNLDINSADTSHGVAFGFCF